MLMFYFLSLQSTQVLQKNLLRKRIATFLAVLVLILLTRFLTSKVIEHSRTAPTSGYIEFKISDSDNLNLSMVILYLKNHRFHACSFFI